MDLKTITVNGDDAVIGDTDDFKALLDSYGVSCLLNEKGQRVFGFTSLVDGGTYTGAVQSVRLFLELSMIVFVEVWSSNHVSVSPPRKVSPLSVRV